MLEAVDGELCRPELREWLLSSAEISLNHIDRLLVVHARRPVRGQCDRSGTVG